MIISVIHYKYKVETLNLKHRDKEREGDKEHL